MTKEEKIIATAFTGRMFIDGSEMGSLYEYMEKKVGHGVIDLMLASKEFWEELHKACEQDFIDMVSKEQPSLPSNLDEAALKELQVYLPQGNGPDGICYFIAPQMLAMYKAGAELMAGQGVTCEGVIFGNKYFRHKNVEMHLSDEKYDKVGDFGDKVIVQIRKK